MSRFTEIYVRVCNAALIKSQRQLAEIVGAKSPAITDAKKRGVFPLAWVFKISEIFNISTDHLLFGSLPIYREGLDPSSRQGEEESPSALINELRMGVDFLIRVNRILENNNKLLKQINQETQNKIAQIAQQSESAIKNIPAPPIAKRLYFFGNNLVDHSGIETIKAQA